MRTIKFRGKRVGNGEWVYGWYVGYSEAEGYIYGDYIDNAEVWKVDNKTVGQFTGLHDKNGKEIYEGDVIEYNDENYEVYYNEGGYEPMEYYQMDTSRWVWVIGNIHENPELLK